MNGYCKCGKLIEGQHSRMLGICIECQIKANNAEIEARRREARREDKAVQRYYEYAVNVLEQAVGGHRYN